MTRTTKLVSRKKQTKTAEPSRYAPRYPTLDIDGYGALSPVERRRYDLLRDLEQILDATPHAEHELEALGWKTNLRPSDSSGGGLDVELDEDGIEVAKLTPVEAAAERGVIVRSGRLTDWLAEAKEATAQIVRVARFARQVGPRPLEAGTHAGGIVVGQRSENAETCPWCGDPITEGRDPETGKSLIHRVDGQPLHATTCYYQADRRARAAGVAIGTFLAANPQTQRSAS